MKRPKLVHFTAIESDEYIHIRASMTFSSQGRFEILDEINFNLKELVPTRPIQSMGLLSSNVFRLKIIGLSQNDTEEIVRSFDSDTFGNFNVKIPQP